MPLAIGIGIGLSFTRASAAAIGAIQNIAPAVGWTGTADSVAAPSGWTDPTRLTAKPGLAPLYDTGGLCFDEGDLIIGFHAYAGNGTGAIEGTFELLIEGNVYTLTRQSRVRIDVNGDLKTEWGYFARLKHSAFTQDGSVFVRARFTPSDGTQQARVIGPYKYTRRPAGQLHDVTLEVAPSQPQVSGSRYQTIAAALNYCSTNAKQNPLIEISETNDYSLPSGSLTAYTGGTGYATIQTRAGVTATFKATATIGNYVSASNISLHYNGLWFRGSGCVFDFAYINTLAPDGNVGVNPKDPIFEGVEWTNSAGRNSRYNLRRWAIKTFSTNGSNAKAICRDMVCHDLLDAYHGDFSIVLQSEAYNIAEDITKGPSNIYGLYIHDVRGDDVKAGYSALTVAKTGSNFFRLTKRTSGSNGSPIYVLDLESSANGSTWTTDTTITLGNFLAPTTITALVAAINSFASGWTATLLNDVYDADNLTFISDPTVTPSPTGNSGSVASGGSFTLWQRFDVHGDVIQPGGATFSDNMLFVNIRGTLTQNWQQIFWQTGTYRDCFIINHACYGALQGSVQGFAQCVVPMQNCHFWHMSLDQTFFFSSASSTDAYCSVKSSLFGHDVTGMSINTPANHSATIDGNHFCAGAAPSGATNSSTGSSFSVLLNAPSTADFSPKPAGGLASRTSQVPFDNSGARRGSTSSVGAMA